MALLQIAEPGQSSAPHEHRIAIGIDLGTTHSFVATVLSGKAKVLQDEQSRVLLPSIVHYSYRFNSIMVMKPKPFHHRSQKYHCFCKTLYGAFKSRH